MSPPPAETAYLFRHALLRDACARAGVAPFDGIPASDSKPLT